MCADYAKDYREACVDNPPKMNIPDNQVAFYCLLVGFLVEEASWREDFKNQSHGISFILVGLSG